MGEQRSGCPINLTLETLGDRWSLIVIRDIMFGNRRHFRELLTKSEEGIASNILSDRLAMLEREGILTKTDDPAHKQKNIYRLTEMGIDLLPVMVEIGGWSIKHKPVDLKKHKHAKDLVKSGKEGLIELRKQLVNEHLK